MYHCERGIRAFQGGTLLTSATVRKIGMTPSQWLVVVGSAGILLAWVSASFLYAADDRETADQPPDYQDLYTGIVLLLLAVPLSAWALRGPGAPRVLGFIGLGFAAWSVLSLLAVLFNPPL